MWWLIGFGFSTFGIWLIVSIPRAKENAKELINKKRIDLLKLSGKRIPIDLLKCEIKSGYSVQTAPEYDGALVLLAGRIPGLIDNLTDDGKTLPVGSEIKKSVLVFSTELDGKKIKFVSQIIPKDVITLVFLCGMKKETLLYVDENDLKNCWFDLEFLND